MRPEDLYRDSGWNGYGDWLGSGIVPVQNRKFRSFVEAREFVRSLGLRSSRQWEAFCQGKLPDKGKRPVDIPTCPRRVYQDAGWSGFPDWLGTRTDGKAL